MSLRTSEKGYAILAMTFAASIVVGMMIYTTNQVYKNSAETRSYVKEQLAALDLMKEIGVMLRRGYDIRQNMGGTACPPNYTNHEFPVASGTENICIPDGQYSCFAHPMDPTPTDSNRPKICLDNVAFSTRVNLAFSPDKTKDEKQWASIYKEWNVTDERLTKFVENLSRQFALIPQAHAQNNQASPWYPTPTAVAAGVGTGYGVTVANPGNFTRTCGSANMLCVTYSVCLRISGCTGHFMRDRFAQTVGLDRAVP